MRLLLHLPPVIDTKEEEDFFFYKKRQLHKISSLKVIKFEKNKNKKWHYLSFPTLALVRPSVFLIMGIVSDI